jgi:TnpA family transposase
MTKIEETAYPKLNPHPTEAEIKAHFAASPEEWAFVCQIAQAADAQLAALFHLKLHQNLGRFISLEEAPPTILEKVAMSVGRTRVPTKEELKRYDASPNSRRHLTRIREFREAKPYTAETAAWLATVAEKAVEVKSRLPEVINILLEELIRNSSDLPSFAALDRIAGAAREKIHNRHYETINGQLNPLTRVTMDKLLENTSEQTGWNSLKREARQPTNKEVRHYLQHVVRMKDLSGQLPKLDMPNAKYRFFCDYAASLNVDELRDLKPAKRYALIAIYIRSQYAKTLDDAGAIFVKMVRDMENSATAHLISHQLEHNERAEKLIAQLKQVLEAFATEGSNKARIAAINNALEEDTQALIEQCVEHLAYAGKNFLPFMLRPYGPQRPILMNCIDIMSLKSASDDKVMEMMIAVLARCRASKTLLIAPEALGIDVEEDLSWMPAQWRKHVLVKGESSDAPVLLHRKYLELAILCQIKEEITSADLYIPGGDDYDDFREQLVDDATLDRETPEFATVSGMPADPKEFTRQLKAQMVEVSDRVDRAFPENSHARLVNDQIVLTPLKRQPLAQAVKDLDYELNQRMAQTTIVDILVEMTKWLGVERHFKPLSGTEPRIDDLLRRVVLTLFCYGCNLGPTDTARCIRGMSRKQVAWLNLKYVNEETLLLAINDVINAYNKLDLPTYWGTNMSASADGKKWTMRENTIMAEHHIRYGGYGGIGYYIVSDTYIALYSRFITCGSYEGHYILDCLMANTSDVQPTQLHGDTHAQNYIAFGLAPFLGADLMPRIRRFKDLNLYRPTPGKKYKHIDALFDHTIKWDLVERHYKDILRFAVSIKLGRISPSTILRRFHSKSKKNKVYQALHEVGAAYRTIFMLRFIEDPQLRKMISAATNKSEAFNQFIKWAFFANEGLIDETVRHEQRKLIRYNHLVANMLMFHNVQGMQRVLVDLRQEGWDITPEMLEALGPYRTAHINRFGQHELDITRSVDGLRQAAEIPLAKALQHNRPERVQSAKK